MKTCILNIKSSNNCDLLFGVFNVQNIHNMYTGYNYCMK